MDFELDGQRFNWLDEKAALNIERHGVSFPEATEALSDPGQVTLDDLAHSEPGKPRYTGIGFSRELRLLRVTFRVLPGNVVHIISAREASDYERRLYARKNQ
jgi:uncharacterized protein